MTKIWKTPKAYLNQVRALDELIHTNLESMSSLRTRLFSISAKLSPDRPSSGGGFDFTDLVAKIDAMEHEVDREIDSIVELRKVIESEIKSLESNIHVLVLINYYVIGKSLIDISKEYSYGISYIKHVHGWALEAFRDKFPEKFEKSKR